MFLLIRVEGLYNEPACSDILERSYLKKGFKMFIALSISFLCILFIILKKLAKKNLIELKLSCIAAIYAQLEDKKKLNQISESQYLKLREYIGNNSIIINEHIDSYIDHVKQFGTEFNDDEYFNVVENWIQIAWPAICAGIYSGEKLEETFKKSVTVWESEMLKAAG